jgi:hypothetical protein
MPFVESAPGGVSQTGNSIIEEVLRLLLSGQREEMNKLATSVSAGATTLGFKFDLGGIRAGALIDIDLETFRIWSVDSEAKTAIVEPGMNGTVRGLHNEDALVYVNPRMSRHAIFKALNDELLGLSAPSNGLYAVKYVDFTYGVASDYDVAADAMEVLDVRIDLPGPEKDWMQLNDWSWNPKADPSTFPTGVSLHLPQGVPGRTVRVVYKAAFTPLPSPNSDLFSTTGMPAEMQDILALGVLLRLGPVREIKRNFTEAQGDTRRADEVGAGTVMQSFSYVRQKYNERIDLEAQRLAVRFPLRHR